MNGASADRKTEKVRAHFGQGTPYLKDNYNIRLRREIVRDMLTGARFRSILDVACGNAEVSLPFLTAEGHLTLLDISPAMLEAADRNIPEDLRGRAELRNEDFLRAEFPARSYDLIICTGLLAHIKDPVATLEKISALLMPGGCLILQNTDADHPYSRLIKLYRWMGALLAPTRYQYNRVTESMIINILAERGIELKKRFSYIQSFLIFDRLMKPSVSDWLIRRLFGNAGRNMMPWLGNDRLYLFCMRGDIK